MSRKSITLRNHESHIIGTNGTMSEKVQLVANSIYKEFERMINHFGADVLECLMPLIVGVLENLDELYKTKQNDELEIEIIKEDNTTLANQYDKEKALRKRAEERLFDVEFMYDEEKKRLEETVQETESSLRISELKLRSANDMITRLEQKEKELKIENQKLYERYTDTFKSHGDLLQRLKRCNLTAFSPPSSIHLSSKCSNKQHCLPNEEITESSAQKGNLQSGTTDKELVGEDYFQSQMIDNLRRNSFKEEISVDIFCDDQWMTDPISESLLMPQHQNRIASSDYTINKYNPKSSHFGSCRNIEDDMVTAENSVEYNNADSDTDLTDDEFGIRRDIEGLLRENQDLVDTKNALNIVKDDLITRLDSVTSENDMLKEDIHQHINKQTDLSAKVAFLEQELIKCKEEIKILNEAQSNHSGISINTEQKSFSRSEMSVLLQERNHYKERLLELQDAMVYTEMMRIKKQFPDHDDTLKPTKTHNSSVWNFFKNVAKTDVPEAIEEKSKLLKTRFRLENNRSQLYSWSIPRALIESTLPKRIPIPIKIQRVFEPKDIVICSTLGYEECPTSSPASYLWCLIQSSNKHYSLILSSLSTKQPELMIKYCIGLQFPTSPFNICEVPALVHVIKEFGATQICTVEDNTTMKVNDSNEEQSPTETTKITKIFHTKVNIKQKSKSSIGNKTLWFGCEKNQLAVFVIFENNKLEGRMATANLPSEIDFIKYHIGRVFVMTKNGNVCIFDLNKELSQWELHQCLMMDISNGLPIATTCCDTEFLSLWFGSSTNCFILGLSNLMIQRSWSVTDDTPSLDQCTAIESIVKIDKLSLMLLAVSRIGSLIGYDARTFEIRMYIDLRPCVFDLIEPVAGMTTSTLSLYHLVDDGNRLWMVTDCGMILVITSDCINGHLNNRSSKISLHSDEVLISSHAFAQCLKTICLLTYNTPTLANGDHDCSKGTNDSKITEDKTLLQNSVLMIAIGSCYVNLNNSVSDILNMSNRALLWKI